MDNELNNPPTWTAVLPIYINALKQHKNVPARKAAEAELFRLAAMVDRTAALLVHKNNPNQFKEGAK